jgi:AcrR family transcriptional regulator
MGILERRDRERQELRQAILDAARDLAAQEGWQAVTIRRVAERIEYSPPTIYEHFAGKEALLTELMRQGFRLLLGAMEAGAGAAGDPAARVLAIGRAYWEFAWRNPELYQVMLGLGVPFAAAGADSLAGGHIDEAEAVFAFTVAAIGGLPSMRAADPTALEDGVAIVWSTLHGLVALTMAGRLKCEREQAGALVDRAMQDFIAARSIQQ